MQVTIKVPYQIKIAWSALHQKMWNLTCRILPRYLEDGTNLQWTHALLVSLGPLTLKLSSMTMHANTSLTGTLWLKFEP